MIRKKESMINVMRCKRKARVEASKWKEESDKYKKSITGGKYEAEEGIITNEKRRYGNRIGGCYEDCKQTSRTRRSR